MKKILLLIFLFIPCFCFSNEKRQDAIIRLEEDMKLHSAIFVGTHVYGEINQYCKKLESVRPDFVCVLRDPTVITYEGTIFGEECMIYVIGTPISRNVKSYVYRVAVRFNSIYIGVDDIRDRMSKKYFEVDFMKPEEGYCYMQKDDDRNDVWIGSKAVYLLKVEGLWSLIFTNQSAENWNKQMEDYLMM